LTELTVLVTDLWGFAPFFAQTLVEVTGSKLAPSYYIMVTALLSLISLFILRGRIEPLPIAKRESL
jgi:MFS transporter, MHS family, proline/betaine transporter